MSCFIYSLLINLHCDAILLSTQVTDFFFHFQSTMNVKSFLCILMHQCPNDIQCTCPRIRKKDINIYIYIYELLNILRKWLY